MDGIGGELWIVNGIRKRDGKDDDVVFVQVVKDPEELDTLLSDLRRDMPHGQGVEYDALSLVV